MLSNTVMPVVFKSMVPPQKLRRGATLCCLTMHPFGGLDSHSLSANRSPEENDAVRESTIGLTDCSPAAIGMELNANRKRRGRSVRAPFDNNSWPRRGPSGTAWYLMTGRVLFSPTHSRTLEITYRKFGTNSVNRLNCTFTAAAGK